MSTSGGIVPLSTIEIPLDGFDQLGVTPLTWADAATRVNARLIGRPYVLLGARLKADGGIATNFGATPARDISVKLKKLAITGSVFDVQANDTDLLTATCPAGANFGPLVTPTGLVTLDADSWLTADCVIAGGTPIADSGQKWMTWRQKQASVGLSLSHSVASHLGGFTAITASITHDSAGATALTNALVAAGYTPPNPITYQATGTFPYDDTTYSFLNGLPSANGFWWQVPSLATDPGVGAASFLGANSNTNDLGSYDVRPAAPAGSPAAGVSLLVYLG